MIIKFIFELYPKIDIAPLGHLSLRELYVRITLHIDIILVFLFLTQREILMAKGDDNFICYEYNI